jgi:hypothetical protein
VMVPVWAQSSLPSGTTSTTAAVVSGDSRVNGALYVDGGVTAQTFTSVQWDGGNAFSIPQGSRIDLGGGLSDYLESDGSAVAAGGNFNVVNGSIYGTTISVGATGITGNGANFLLINPGSTGGGGFNTCFGDGTGSTCDGALGAGAITTAAITSTTSSSLVAVSVTNYLASTGIFYLRGTTATNDTSNQPFSINDAEGLGIVGVATGSLATCNSTAPPTGTRGTIQYDTTTNTLKLCNGTTWKGITLDP